VLSIMSSLAFLGLMASKKRAKLSRR
jgi:hypothetical protein